MNCPNCGGNLAEKGLYCPHCGTKIPYDFAVKIDSRQEILDHAKVVEAQNKGKTDIAKEKTKRNKGCLTVIIVLILACVALTVYFDYSDRIERERASYELDESMRDFNQPRNNHLNEIKRLQKIEDEILEDIRNERYEQALVKVNTLYYTSGYSKETKEAWDTKREALITQLTNLIGK